MRTVLIVDSSGLAASLLRRRLEGPEGPSVENVRTAADAVARVEDWSQPVALAVVGLILPDAPNGEIVWMLRERGVPVIVLTGSINDELRAQMLQLQVVDYVHKRDAGDLDYVVWLVRRFIGNLSHRALIVDDQRTQRRVLRQALERLGVSVFEAASGEEALAVYEAKTPITLALVDVNMPGMDGVELVHRLRAKASRERLSIIGVSASQGPQASATLLKAGANDYVHKPIHFEEFSCRVHNAIEMVEALHRIREASIRDPLTGLHNRRHAMDEGKALVRRVARDRGSVHVALIDIDRFKAVNDTYGHGIGDRALEVVADSIRGNVPEDGLVARWGGEEFCVILPRDGDPVGVLEPVRSAVEHAVFEVDGVRVPLSVSIGVAQVGQAGLADALERADAELYRAKRTGRNRVCVERARLRRPA